MSIFDIPSDPTPITVQYFIDNKWPCFHQKYPIYFKTIYHPTGEPMAITYDFADHIARCHIFNVEVDHIYTIFVINFECFIESCKNLIIE